MPINLNFGQFVLLKNILEPFKQKEKAQKKFWTKIWYIYIYIYNIASLNAQKRPHGKKPKINPHLLLRQIFKSTKIIIIKFL